MKMAAGFMAISVLIFLGCALSAAAEVVLVEDSRARCTIVTGEDDGVTMRHSMLRSDISRVVPARVLEHAAGELAEHLNDIGWIGDPGHTVDIVKEADGARTPYRILLGTAAIEEYGLHEEAAELSYPAYIYRTVGNDLLIFGTSSKGTANGIYGFLQDELGVRWFGPQELFRVLPGRSDRIAVGELDRRVEPSFTGRFGVSGPHDDLWKKRMRLAEGTDISRTSGVEPFFIVSHNVHTLVRYDEYFHTNPEYFQMHRGRRTPHPFFQTNLCWSNPDVIEKSAEAALRHFRGGENRHTFSLTITDMNAYCDCEECTALQPDREFRGRRVASDMYFHFVNEVARRVKGEFPDRYIGVIAYRDVTPAPLGEIEDNVFAMLVLDISEHYDESYREQEDELIRAWEEKGITLGMYYYTGLAKLVPAYFPRHLAGVLKDIHAGGFRGLRNECNPGWPWNGPMAYVDARLWWDVDLCVDELLEEYFEMLYGPAAPYVSELYELFEEIHMRPRKGGWFFEHYNFLQFRPYTGEDLEKMRELISSAHGAIEEFGTDWRRMANLEERRLAYTTHGLSPFLDMLEGVVLARELEEEGFDGSITGVLDTLHKIGRLNTLLRRHEQVYREAVIKDEYQNHRYTGDTATPVRKQWQQYLFGTAGETLVDIYRMLNFSAVAYPESVHGYFIRTADEYCAIDISGEALFRLGTGEWSLEGENLIKNPGFEKADGVHPHYPEHLDWEASGADNWAFWQFGGVYTGEFTVSEDVKRSGTRSGHAYGVDRGVLVGLGPDVEPGEYYYFEAYVKNLADPEDGTGVAVQIDWLDEDDRWLRERTLHRVEGFGAWVKADAIIKAPENAATAVILFSVTSLPYGSSIHFDDVLFRKIAIGG